MGTQPPPELNDVHAALADAAAARQAGELAESMGHARRALAAARSAGQASLQLDALLAIAGLCSNVDDTDGAVDALEQARPLVQLAGEDARAFRLFSLLAISLSAMNDFERAFAAQHTAIEIAERLAVPRLSGIGQSNFAARYIDLGEWRRNQGDGTGALQAFEQAAAISLPLLADARATGEAQIECAAGANLGAALVELGRPAEALPILAASAELARSTGMQPSLINGALYRARALLALGDTTGARDAATAGLELGGDEAAPLGLAGLHDFLCRLDESRGDLAQALHHHRRFHDLTMKTTTRTAGQRSRMLAVQLQTERALAEAAQAVQRAKEIERAHAALSVRAQELSLQAEQDALTGLANRRRLDEGLAGAHADARSRALPLCVAMVDIDHFKRINDQHSHAVGDAVLRQLARLLREQCRDGDLAARYGGEEFTIVLKGVGLARAVSIAERLRGRIESAEWHSIAPGLAVTASLGVCDIALHVDPAAGMAQADELLYRAKHGGRNRVAVAP